jgi:type I restriction enzyme S subunit
VRAGWETSTLGAICAIKPPKSEARRRLKGTDLVSFVPMNNLGVREKSLRLVESKPLDEVVGSYTYFADGDVLLAKITPCFENGKLGIASGLVNGAGFGSSEFVVFRPNEQLLQEFLFYFLSQDCFRTAGARTMSGAVGHKRITNEFIENYPINLPSIAEQKRIVALLDEAFTGLAAAIANATKNLGNARELFDSYLNSAFMKQSESWVEMKLGDKNLLAIIDGDRGKNYPTKDDYLEDGYCLFLNTKNVRPDGFAFDSLMFISKEKDELMGKGKLKRRDVVMTTRGTIGNIAIYDERVEFNVIRINSGMLIFRPNEQVILAEYLFEALRSSVMKSQITKYVSGAAQPQLPIKTLVNFVLPVPRNLGEQRQLVADLKELEIEVNRLEAIYEQKLNSLIELKQSLLHQAFTGQLTTSAEFDDVAA